MEALSMTTNVERCQEIIGYQFQDSLVAWEALQMAGSGVFRAGTRNIPDGNKRLAVLGDLALEIVLCKKWYDGGDPKGSWNELRQSTTSNSNLSKLGKDHGLDACIHVNPMNPQAISANMMATTVEALIGAAFFDGGLPAARIVMVSLGLLENDTN